MDRNRLKVLDDLLSMVRTGEVDTGEDKDDLEWALLSVRRMVEDNLYQEIISDITDAETGFYAPEHKSWKEFLAFCNGYADYKEILEKEFSEAELDALWRYSHPEEEMSRGQMMVRVFNKLCELKMNALFDVSAGPCKVSIENKRRIGEMFKAAIKGIYNILYESAGEV